MNTDQLSGSLAENILTLLCFDDTAAPIIVNSVDVGLFESDIYKEIAKRAFEYYREFKTSPKDHLPDLFEDLLNDKVNPRKAELYQRTLINLHEFQSDINRDYVLSKLTGFVRQQRLKSAIVDATTYVREGNLDNAETVLNNALKSTLDIFHPGIQFTDSQNSLRFFDELTPSYMTGVKPLDDMKFGPAPGELMVILAPANRGKTWFMVHLGKFCAIQRLKVLHLSLEMSEEKMAQRYVQTFFSYGKRKAEASYVKFNTDEMGRFTTMSLSDIVRPTIQQTTEANSMKVYHDLIQKLDRVHGRLKLWIKRFPTGALTISGLEAYLDSMDRFYHYHPDVLLVDYADLMNLDSSHLRTETGKLYKELRRIAVERNIAMVTASQANRLGEDAKIITLKHLAEDYSKAATADNIIAYCQTSQELRLGLARLFIAKARDEEREQTVLISQCYRIGQFCMNAIHMQNRYWDELDVMAGSPAETEEKEEPKPRRLGKVKERVKLS
jgi:replicative DNA helicase